MREKVKKLINNYIQKYKKEYRIETIEKPLIAFANAHDPLFLELKKIIGDSHKLPRELLPNANSIISYFIPFKMEIVQSNSKGERCSEEWVLTYIKVNKLITDLNDFLAYKLKKLDFDSINIPPTHNFDKSKLVSYWSHKHAAYIAGLGKFGLHKMLITDKGCCGRLGSLITTAKIKASERRNNEYCLYFYNKSCKKCVENCIFGALKLGTFDRHKCYSVLKDNGKFYSKFGLADVCGKCACIVPCSLENPVKSAE